MGLGKGGPGKPRRPSNPSNLARYERRMAALEREEAAKEAHAYLTNVILGIEEYDQGKYLVARELMDRGWGKAAQRNEHIDVTRVALALLERGIDPRDAVSDPALRSFIQAMGISPESLGYVPQIVDVQTSDMDNDDPSLC